MSAPGGEGAKSGLTIMEVGAGPTHEICGDSVLLFIKTNMGTKYE